MANAAEEIPEEAEVEEAPKGGGGLKWVIIGVVALVILGGGAGAWFFLSGDAKSEKPKPTEKEQVAALAGPIISLAPFIVNLADPKGKRYLKVKVEMELSNQVTEKELRKRMPQVRDQIILSLSSKSYQQVRGVPGKNVLRDELTARTNAILKLGKVKKVYFTDFVVQ
jgi:flagellar FliL protein